VDGLTGEAAPGAVWADATVTFAALKPGLVLGEGPSRAGRVEVADIGLDVTAATIGVVEGADVAGWLPRRPREAHKWQVAVWVAAGSPGMTGAARLCARAALRAGAGSVRVGSPGLAAGNYDTGEAIAWSLPAEKWDEAVLADVGERFGALVVGPGLGRHEAVAAAVRRLVAEAPVPVVVDADGLFVLGQAGEVAALLEGRAHPVVLTPHEGEFARLAGGAPGPDRLGATRALARRTGAVVLLKGPTTVVAAPDGHGLLATAGGPRLATAGTGDVLAGVVATFLAQGLDPLRAAAGAAHVHGRAAHLGWSRGLVAGDVVDLLPAALADL
jgi:NAD(P)H-hydrate epimerase